MKFKKDDVVQFTDCHKWCRCLGIVQEAKQCIGDVRYMIGVPIPQKGTAFIFSMESAGEIERIGRAAFILKEEESE